MSERQFTLDEQIDGEVETIMYTCAPQSVKAEARKRRDALIRMRDHARSKQVKPPRAGNPHCHRCGGFGYLIFSIDDGEWEVCGCA